ncbi:hypothetical protein D3C80_700440 [compost metagenome]
MQKTKSRRRLFGGRVVTVALPFATAIAQILKQVPQHQINRLGGTGALFHRR